MGRELNNLIPPETQVRFTHNQNLTGFVDGICIRGKNLDRVEYLVIFWVGTERKEEWVKPREIEIVPPPEPMGFKPSNNQNLLR